MVYEVKGTIKPGNQVEVRQGGQFFVASVIELNDDIATMAYDNNIFTVDFG